MSSRYILMLEDDVDDRLITQLFFKENGHDIAIEFLADANDVFPFLERCLADKSRFPELILMDKNVPVGSSMETLRQIKEHPTFCVIPVIVISGTALPADVAECYKLGANSFIIKPDNAEETARTINSFINYWFNLVELSSPEVPEDIFS